MKMAKHQHQHQHQHQHHCTSTSTIIINININNNNNIIIIIIIIILSSTSFTQHVSYGCVSTCYISSQLVLETDDDLVQPSDGPPNSLDCSG